MTEYRVLIADDEKGFCDLLEKSVNRMDGYRVVGKAYDGQRAAELAAELRPDILITDINMPKLSGLDLLRRVRETDGEIETLVISGYSEFSYAKTAMTLGVNDYLVKPFLPDELQDVLHKMSGQIETRKTLAENLTQLQQEADASRREQRERFLKKLATGEPAAAPEELVREGAALGVALDLGMYCVCVAHLHPPFDHLLDLLQCGYFSAETVVLGTVPGDKITVLLLGSTAGSELAFYKDIESGMARITHSLAVHYNTRLWCAVGNIYNNVGEIAASYREAARVLAANGITAFLYPRLEPTPALSWAVRTLGCGAGICITASHNPAEYNGYKVYGADGCQITSRAADDILAAMERHDYFESPRVADYAQAVADGLIREIDDSCLSDFVDAVLRLRSTGDVRGLRLVYTPLNGSGLEPVRMLLGRMGIPDENITVVPAQEQPDGDFPTCPYPNPEIREAMAEGLRLCDAVRPDLLLGTDPDCDRMGAAVPDGAGGYRLITGNEMGVLLLDYICRTRIANGTMPARPVAVTTIVSTDMAAPVAAKYGVELRRTLTGFKYIGEQIGLLEAEGHPERFLFGFEESYGYLSGTHVRDKDAVNAVMLACECAACYAAKGMTLLDALQALYAEFGFYRNALRSVSFAGESGMKAMRDIMAHLRTKPPAEIAGYAVKGVTDYQDGSAGLPKADVLEYRLSGGAKLIVRPSGTEPKIKVYLSAVGRSEAAADSMIEALAGAAGALLHGK